MPIIMDQDVEPLAYPCLFPRGLHHFKARREVEISESEYAKNRILHQDSRFRKSIPYLFFLFYKLEYNRLISSMNISLRKGVAGGGDEGPVTAADLKDPAGVPRLIAQDNAYRFLGRSRGSPAFWSSALKDLMGMMKMLGPPTFFVTFSADDRHWEEVLRQCWEAEHPGKRISTEEIHALSTIQRNALLRKQPTFAALHFHHRVQNLFKHVINGASRPIGNVIDHFARYEWQARGKDCSIADPGNIMS
jgi:hypothetical protein